MPGTPDRRPTTARAKVLAMACAVLLSVQAGADVIKLEQRLVIQANQVVQQTGDDLLLLQPGFQLPMASEDVQKQIGSFNGFLDEQDWGRAFRVLSELSDDQLQTMVPIGDQGLHVAIREQLQRQLLNLPPDGLRAFRLYFDGQAREMLDEVRNHPRPGSEDQLVRAQALVDRLLATSVGGEAVSLLGDLYFERGGFARAERCWAVALQQGLASGEQELALQTKRVIAKQRGGDTGGAAMLYQELKARYGDAEILVGGQRVDALAMLGDTLGKLDPGARDDAGGAGSVMELPEEGTMPAWHLKFLDTVTASNMSGQQSRYGYYRGPSTLRRFVPSAAGDDERVYFQWLDVVFALNRQSGKIVWKHGSMLDVSNSVQVRQNSNAGDPRNYRLSLTGDTLLATSAGVEQANTGVFTLKAYNTKTGGVRWASDTHPGWPIRDEKGTPQQTTVIGEVLVNSGSAYTVVHRVGQTDCFLRRFNPDTGEVLSTIALGSADPLQFRYTNIRRMPQPQMMVHQGMLLVLMGNGVLTSVDITAGQIAWALRLDVPLGIGQDPNRNSMANTLENLANPNGSGAMILANGELYAKQHRGNTLFAIDPAVGRVKWSVSGLKPDAKLVAVNSERFYLMDRELHAYKLGGEPDEGWKTWPREHSLPDHAAVLSNPGQLMVFEHHRLKLIDPDSGKTVQAYRNDDYLGNKGGRIYRFGDLLVCVDQRQITAFRVGPDDAGP